jgi:hypothetical protein
MRASVAAGPAALPPDVAAQARLQVAELEGALQAAAPAAASGAASDKPGTPILPLDAAALEALLTQRGVQVVPVACILGGVIANQIVSVLAGRGKPLHNVLMLDAMASLCVTTLAPGPRPPPVEGGGAASTASAVAPRAAAVAIDDDSNNGADDGAIVLE